MTLPSLSVAVYLFRSVGRMVCRSLVLCRSRTLSCGASVAPVNAQHGTPTNGQPTEAVTFDGRQARLLDGELALEAGILNHNL